MDTRKKYEINIALTCIIFCILALPVFAAKPYQVKDINVGTNNSYATWLTNVNCALFFSATADQWGDWLWKSDCTEAGPVSIINNKEANPNRYRFAVDNGARFVPTSDGRSFYVLWTPKDFDKAQLRPIIITLHGHASWAFDEFFLWQPYAEQRGYGIIALQWWFGGGEAINDYYLPQEMYPIFKQALLNHRIEPGKVLFHGFSRGSTNSYALTALDRQSSQFIGLTISNAGGMAKDFPPNFDILNGGFGKTPFKGAHWVMYCGVKDPNPERDGCEAMQDTRELLTSYGATVDLLIQDPAGDHGGFHRNPANVNTALDVFDKLIGK